MKGTINLHDKWGWGVINHTDESIPDWIPLHPDDLNHFAEMKEKFDNFEARVLSSPEVEFETIIHPKFTGRIIYAKLNTKEEPKQDLEKEMFDLEQELDIPSHLRWHNSKPKQESPEEPTMIDDWLNEYGDPEIYKKVERELELREGASKWSLEEAQEFALSKFTKDSNPKKGVVKWEDILEVLKVGVLTGHKFGAKWQQERMKQKFMYVATWDGIPILGAPNRELLEQALNEYNNDTPIRYEAYNPKYPDDLEGWYYYKDPQTEGEECMFSVRCIEFKGE